MPTQFRSLCFLAITVFYCNTLFAQQPNLGCNDKAMRLQAEQIKQDFTTQGMVTYKDAMITMESKQPFPIAVQFEKGKLYQLIFIGSKTANKIAMELYDGADKQIDERTVKTDKQNFIVYSFTPEKSDMYLVILKQHKGIKNMCGSFSIMQQVDKNAPKPAAKPAAATPAVKPAVKPATASPRYVPKKK